MATLQHIVGLAAVGLIVTGCVSSTDHRKLRAEHEQTKSMLAQTQEENALVKSENQQYQHQLGQIDMLGQEVLELSARNATLEAELSELNHRYDTAMASGKRLSPELASELAKFAGANADVVEFDAERQVIKFKSDFSFAMGSADLTPKARETLKKLARVLNDNSVVPYEIMVAGHTDNVKVARPATKAAGHKDNWYLSAHRAISVGNELQTNKVGSERLAMVGYADQRPVASNASDAGRSADRRAEALLLPTTASVAESAAPTEPA